MTSPKGIGMQSIIIVAGFALTAFGIGYSFRRVNEGWQDKASSAKADADLQAEQLKATFSASLDGIIIIDSNGYILEFSESAERIFGYEKSAVLGKEMSEGISLLHIFATFRTLKPRKNRFLMPKRQRSWPTVQRHNLFLL